MTEQHRGSPITSGTLVESLIPLGTALQEALHALVGCDISVEEPTLEHTHGEQLGGFDAGAKLAVVRAAFVHAGSTQSLRWWTTVAAANALASHLLKHDDDKRKAALESEDLAGEEFEAFTEVGRGLIPVLQAHWRGSIAPELAIEVEGTLTVDAGESAGAELGDGDAALFGFQLTVADTEPAPCWLTVDLDVAIDWNRADLVWEGADETPNGRLAVFLVDRTMVSTVRTACRRAGYEFTRFPPSSIPNPAAHRDEVVLLDVPSAEPRRFDWCQRIKKYNHKIPVAIILHEPSRETVFRAFRAGADIILAAPLKARDLARKLRTLKLAAVD